MGKRFLSAIAAILASAGLAWAVSIPYYVSADSTNLTATLNTLVQSINTQVTPQSTATFTNFRNVVDNGDMAVTQRGTGIATCGTNTAPTVTAAGADRWFCDVNVASGAGRMVISTTTPPPGFSNWLGLYRTSGALTQPVCAMHQIGQQEAIAIQGQQVMLSLYMRDLGGLVTDNGGIVNAYIISGTGATEQGFGTLTASTAITPAWTGLAGGTTAAGTWTISSTTARYQLATPFVVPVAATQVGLELCFTPTATGSGTTDGFNFTGVQLEALGVNSTGPSAFEHLPYAIELAKAERYYWQLNEPAAHVPVPMVGMAESTTVQYLTLALPQQMRGTTPSLAITTGTFAEQIATAQTTWVTPTTTGAGCSTTACGILTANSTTALSGITVTGAGGAGVLAVQNDVIM